MGATLRMLRLLQLAMLGSVVLYVPVAEFAAARPKVVDPAISYLFTMLAVALVGMIFVVRRTLVFRSAASLATQPDDALTLNHWRTGYVITYALCEALSLLGLALRFLGYSLPQSAPYYAGGFVLLVFFGPKSPQAAQAGS